MIMRIVIVGQIVVELIFSLILYMLLQSAAPLWRLLIVFGQMVVVLSILATSMMMMSRLLILKCRDEYSHHILE
jgi:uncharacterized protein (DUF983 family)